MKKCHFSILYNELPFLKQKMDFLYENFDQLIFYDLNVCTKKPHFSTDGSHEFLKDYPDPEKKITIIEKTDLSDVVNYRGEGSIEKRKMFAVGSTYVRDDIQSFWCFDLDEFFNESLLNKVDKIFSENEKINSIDLEHLIFWKNYSIILCDSQKDTYKFYSRIARHKPGNIYGHCDLQKGYPDNFQIDVEDELCYHFAWVGDKRVKSKIEHYITPPTGNPQNKSMYEEWYNNIWIKYEKYKNKISDSLFGYPNMHPNWKAIKSGVKKYEGPYPDYMDMQKLQKELD